MTTLTQQNTLRVAVYARISHDVAGDKHGVASQLDGAEKLAAQRDYMIVARFADNDISALYGKFRPQYDALMAAAARCEFDAIVAFQSSRLWRNRRERAEAIEILRDAGVSVIAQRGPSLDMSTAYGRGMAGLLGEFDTMESEVKAERQQAAAARRAENGRPPLGVRLTGYTVSGEIIEAEAAAVRKMFGLFHAGASLREITRAMARAGAVTRHGGPWTPSSVRTILANPRYCGRAVYQGKPTGQLGGWEPIVSEDLWDAVNGKLADPRRRNQVGTDRKHLGSGLFLCAVCDRPVRSHSGYGIIRYRCPAGGHVTKSAASADQFVLAVLRERLGRPDLAGLLAVPESGQARSAAAEVRRLRVRLEKIENDYDLELIDGRRYKIATEKATAQLRKAESAQARLLAGSGVAATLTAPDPVAAFDAAPLGIQRAVLGFFMTVRLAPGTRGQHFDPESVRIEWRGE